jgi:hypothetical protein
MRDIVNEALARYDVPSDVYEQDVLIDAACVCAADKIVLGLITREEADARVAAALREVAKIAKASDLGIGNVGDRVARITEREILALIPADAGAAFDRVMAEAETRAYKAGWRFAFDQCNATGSVPDPDYDPRARTEGKG